MTDPTRKQVSAKMVLAGVTQLQLAAHLKRSQSHISRVLSGERPAYGDILKRMWEAVDEIEAEATAEAQTETR